MDASRQWTRRTFLQTAALAAASVPLAGEAASAAEPPPPAPGKIRVGALSWCFHDFSPGVDPEPAIDIIGDLGFDGVELIVTARRDLADFWTDERVDRIRKHLEAKKLAVSQFVLFQPVVGDLSSLDADERQRGLDCFEAGCRIGKRIGAPMVNIVSPWARELKGPTGYLPRYYEIGNPKPGEKFHIDIADGFDWDRVWAAYVETTRACTERAKAHGLRFSIEQHTHCLVPDAASFLRLWDAIRDPDLGYNMDVGWTLLQREYPPLAIHKVRKQLMNLHMRDIDGQMRRFVLVGEGVMDFKAIINALKAVAFSGFISIEQDKYPGDMKETCANYLRLTRECIG
jgi:sugar phosphate isomerase/epimerase